MAEIVGLLIGERFLMTNEVIGEPMKQLPLYFSFTDIMNNKTYSSMADTKEWLFPKGIGGNHNLNNCTSYFVTS